MMNPNNKKWELSRNIIALFLIKKFPFYIKNERIVSEL